MFSKRANTGSTNTFVELRIENEIDVELPVVFNNTLFPSPNHSSQQSFPSPNHSSEHSFPKPDDEEIDEEDDEDEVVLVQPTSSTIIDEVRTRSKSTRAQVSLNQTKNAEKMTRKHDHRRNKKTTVFKVGDAVSVLIPRIDRGGTDMPRLPGKVTRVTNDLHEITTAYGVLNDCYRAGDLEPYSGDVSGFTSTTKISMTAAASRASNRDQALKEIEISCGCRTTACSDGRCRCFKNKVHCNSHCHLKIGNQSCCNRQ